MRNENRISVDFHLNVCCYESSKQKCLSRVNLRAFHENPDRIYTEPTFTNPYRKLQTTWLPSKKGIKYVGCNVFESICLLR